MKITIKFSNTERKLLTDGDYAELQDAFSDEVTEFTHALIDHLDEPFDLSVSWGGSCMVHDEHMRHIGATVQVICYGEN